VKIHPNLIITWFQIPFYPLIGSLWGKFNLYPTKCNHRGLITRVDVAAQQRQHWAESRHEDGKRRDFAFFSLPQFVRQSHRKLKILLSALLFTINLNLPLCSWTKTSSWFRFQFILYPQNWFLNNAYMLSIQYLSLSFFSFLCGKILRFDQFGTKKDGKVQLRNATQKKKFI